MTTKTALKPDRCTYSATASSVVNVGSCNSRACKEPSYSRHIPPWFVDSDSSSRRGRAFSTWRKPGGTQAMRSGPAASSCQVSTSATILMLLSLDTGWLVGDWPWVEQPHANMLHRCTATDTDETRQTSLTSTAVHLQSRVMLSRRRHQLVSTVGIQSDSRSADREQNPVKNNKFREQPNTQLQPQPAQTILSLYYITLHYIISNTHSNVKHIKQQKYFHHLKGHGYNKDCVLYPRPLRWWK